MSKLYRISLIVAAILVFTLVIFSVTAQTNVTGCQDLDQNDTEYHIINNIGNTTTWSNLDWDCFVIPTYTTNVTVNCLDNVITGNGSSDAFVVSANDITITRCGIDTVRRGLNIGAPINNLNFSKNNIINWQNQAIRFIDINNSFITGNVIDAENRIINGIEIGNAYFNLIEGNEFLNLNNYSYSMLLVGLDSMTSENNVITSNTFNLTKIGVKLDTANYNNVSYNIFTDGVTRGIELTSNSNDNMIFGNVLRHNETVLDDGTDNVWNLSSGNGGGNNWTGFVDVGYTCVDTTPADGFCDAPFTIRGSGGASDFLPYFISLGGGGLTLIQTLLNPAIDDIFVGDVLEFFLNLTNNNGSNVTSLYLIDMVNNTFLNYSGSSIPPDATDVLGEVEWNITDLEDGKSFEIFLNYTAIGTGITNVTLLLEDDNEDVYNSNVTEVDIMVDDMLNITFTKTLLSSGTANIGDTVEFLINLTNYNGSSLSDLFIIDESNNTFLNFTGEVYPAQESVNTNETLTDMDWNVTNLANGSSLEIYVNFTAIFDATTINQAFLEDAGSNEITNNIAEVNITAGGGPPPFNVLVDKILLSSNNTENGTIEFMINVTNQNGSLIQDYMLVDLFNASILNYTESYPAANITTNVATGEVEWNLTIPNNASYIILVNFTAVQAGTTVNNATLEAPNQTIVGSNDAQVTINAAGGGGPGNTGDYTQTWASMQFAQNFSRNINLFDFLGAPYVARGPGCKLSFDEYGNSTAGQKCCNDGNCNNGSVPLDLGAVWVDEAEDLIAWHIVGPFSNVNNVSICDGIPRQAAYVVEFDIDNKYNESNQPATGCKNPGDGNNDNCYPGADYQIWYFPDNHSTLFMMYNGSNNNSRGEPSGEPVDGISFVPLNNVSNSSVWVSINCTSEQQKGVNIIVNKSVFNTSGTLESIQLNFETNSFNQTAHETNPIDMLTDNGQDAFIFMGPEDDKGKCFQFDNDETACTNSSDEFHCVWNGLGGSNGFCNPDFNNFTSGEACFVETNQSSCENSALGYCEWISNVPLPNGSIGNICVEQFKPFEFSSGDCDSDCFNCFSENQCDTSDANGGSEYGGCTWYNDSFNPVGWCDVKGIKFGCEQNPDDCFTQTECENGGGIDGINWTWDSTWEICKESANIEICFNGIDDNSDTKVDCDDPQCADKKECGGLINTLTGDYQGFSKDDAMMAYLFGNGNPNIVNLAPDNQSETLNETYNLLGMMVAVGPRGIGIGAGVENLTQLYSCGFGGDIKDRKFIYALDTDVNSSTGCNLTVDGTDYEGYNYVIKYGNFSEINKSGQEKYLYRCVNNEWQIKPGLIFNPTGGEPGSTTPMECDVEVDKTPGDVIAYPAVVVVDKADVGNPTDDIKFFIAVVNGSWDNLSNFDSYDILDEAYYTPGSIDFEPVDCFQEPTKCGTEFLYLGGGEYMPFEDCKAPGDEDADGLVNCADPDCSFAPECQGSPDLYDPANDNTAPRVTLNTVERFDNFAFIKWTTNEPTNGTVEFYANNSGCSSLNTTIIDYGIPEIADDDFRPWHHIPLDDGILGYQLTADTTYFYKIKSTDVAGNFAKSKCLNFTTQSVPENVDMIFNFTPKANVSEIAGNIQMEVDNTPISFGGTSSFNSSFIDVNLTISNPNATPENNWSITLVGVDFTKGAILDFDDTFLGNTSGDEGKFVGMENSDWLNLAQKMSVDYVVMQVPENGDNLYHCGDNGTNCTDITSTEGVEKITGQTTPDYSTWKVPNTIGFSTYSSGAGGTNYTMNFTNLTTADLSTTIDLNTSVIIQVNHTTTQYVMYNFSVVAPAQVTAYINDSATLDNINLSENETITVNITVAANETGNFTFELLATKHDNSTVILNSSDDMSMNLEVNTAPQVPAISSIANASTNNESTLITWTTDVSANSTVEYGLTPTLGGINSSVIETTSHSLGIFALTNNTQYYYNVTSCTSAGCNTSGPNTFYTTQNPDVIAPTVTNQEPDEGTNWTTQTITFNINIADNIDIANVTLYHNASGTLSANETNTSGTNNADYNFTITFEDGNYLWNTYACDTTGNCAWDPDNKTLTIDSTTPSLTNETASSLTNVSATISWQTTENTNASVSYGLALNLANGTNSSATLTTSHVFTINNLERESLYYYNITSCDWIGLCNTTGPFNFTTLQDDTTAPVVTTTEPDDGTNTTSQTNYFVANIVDVNNVTNVTLYHNASGTFAANETNTSGTNNADYNFTLTLADGTYFWNVKACDSSGNCDWDSDNKTLTIDSTGPVISSITNASTDNQSTVITWNTNEAANSTLQWGTNTSLGNTNSSTSTTQNHSLSIFDLTNNTQYYYNVTSCDWLGTCTTNGPNTFYTTQNPDTSNPIVTLDLPVNGANTTNQSITFNGTVTDSFNITNVTLYHNATGTWSANETNTSGNNNAEYTFTQTFADGNYLWNILACDTSGNCAFNDTNRTVYIDSIPPSWSTPVNISTNNETAISEQYNATDATGISNYYLSDPQNFTINSTGYLTNNTILTPGNYSLGIYVNDTFNNTNAATINVEINPVYGIYEYTSESQNTNEWTMFGRTHNSNRYYPTSFNATDLGVLWRMQAGDRIYGTPIVYDDIVYVGSKDNSLYGFNATNGSMILNYTTENDVYSQNAVADDLLIFASRNYLYAFNITTGTQFWNYSGLYDVQGITVSADIIYIGDNNYYISAVNITNGSQVWNYTTGLDVYAAPTIVDDYLYVGSNDDYMYALNKTTGVQIWNSSVGGDIDSTAAVTGEVVLVGAADALLYAFNKTDGTQLWNYTTNSGSYASPAVLNDVVYYTTDALYAINISTGTQIWNYTDGYDTYGSATISDNFVVYATLNSKLHVVDITDGSLVWTYALDNYNLVSSPTIANNVLYVSDVNGILYAFSAGNMDLSGPVQSSMINVSTTNVSTNVTWNTDDESINATFNYGSTMALGGFENITTNGTNFSISLSNLVPATIYYYNLTNCNRYSNCTTSGPYNFTTLGNTDTTSPIITLDSPADSARSTSASFSAVANITDNYNITNVTLYGNWTGTWAANETNTSGVNDATYSFSTSVPETTFVWNVLACDESGNCAFASANRTYTYDATAPSISVSYPANLTYLNSGTTFTWINITTNEPATCRFSNNETFNFANGTLMFNSSLINYYYNFTNASSLENGSTYVVYYKCNDTTGNINSVASSTQFTINSTPATINLVVLNDSIVQNNTMVEIVVNVSKTENNIANVTANDVLLTNLSAVSATVGLWNGTITLNTTYTNVTIIVTDVLGFKSTDANTQFDIDDEYPTINIIYPVNGSTYNTSVLDLNFTSTDSYGLNNCWYEPNGTNKTNTTVSCTNASNATTTIYVTNGTHIYTVYINDSAGNVNTSVVTFTVEDTFAPVLSSGLPSGEQSSSTTSVSLQITTDENATCRYSTSNIDYDNMTFNFTDITTAHNATIGVSSGNSYTYYVRCMDLSNNKNNVSTTISFSVASESSSSSGGGGSSGGSIGGAPADEEKNDTSNDGSSVDNDSSAGDDGASELVDDSKAVSEPGVVSQTHSASSNLDLKKKIQDLLKKELDDKEVDKLVENANKVKDKFEISRSIVTRAGYSKIVTAIKYNGDEALSDVLFFEQLAEGFSSEDGVSVSVSSGSYTDVEKDRGYAFKFDSLSKGDIVYLTYETNKETSSAVLDDMNLEAYVGNVEEVVQEEQQLSGTDKGAIVIVVILIIVLVVTVLLYRRGRGKSGYYSAAPPKTATKTSDKSSGVTNPYDRIKKLYGRK